MSEETKGPGILFVESRISQPEQLDQTTYLNWYDDDHIPKIIATGSVDSAFRCILPGSEWPHLALYEMRDIASAKSDEFFNIQEQSHLPGSQLINDLTDTNVRYYRLEQVFDPHKRGTGHTKALMVAQVELKEGYPDEDLDAWFRTEHLLMLAKYSGYLRSTRFKLVKSQSNTQSHGPKGLTSEPRIKPPTWLALHEFDTADLDLAALQAATTSDWTRKIYKNSTTMLLPIYTLDKTHGTGEWFHSFS